MNEADQMVTKVNYTLDTLIDKYESLQERLDEMQSKWWHSRERFSL